MILRKANFKPWLNRLNCLVKPVSQLVNSTLIINCNSEYSKVMGKSLPKFLFCIDGKNTIAISQSRITFQIQKAANSQQLRQLLSKHVSTFNFIHRTFLLQKVTQRPFDLDDQLVQDVVNQIKHKWKQDYPEPTSKNSRAIANTICYMSRKNKRHDLDHQFAAINFFSLAKHLNPKQFVMTLNGLLKLQLLDKVAAANPSFTLNNFLIEYMNQEFTPSLLVSIWFNVLKYQKDNQQINNFFANRLKMKHFKQNMVDYMQIVYCYVQSEGKRTVDLTYSIMTHPKQLKEKSYIGAHQMSVLYEQLAKLKKITNIYLSDEFNDLLQDCYLKILNQKDIPLRNIANVFNNLIQYENPTSKTLQATFHKYFTVLRHQINLLEKYQPGRKFKFKANVDQLSFANLFKQLLQKYQPSNTYINQIYQISLAYVEKLIEHNFLAEYNQRSFVRLLQAVQTGANMIQQTNPGKRPQLKINIKNSLAKQISKRNFNQVVHLSSLISFCYTMDIRTVAVCREFKKLIQSVPEKNQNFNYYHQKLKCKCILHKIPRNCMNCLSV